MILISEWKVTVVPRIAPLVPVWVHVTGVPPPLRHFLGLWAVGSVIGATQDVDLVCLRRRGIIRIQTAVLSKKIFKKKDGARAYASSDVFVKLDGFEFRYELEEDDYVPDEDFIPRIWDHHDNGPDNGANHDEMLPDNDANKKVKNIISNGGSTSSTTNMDTSIPMQTFAIGSVHSNLQVDSLFSFRKGG